MSTPDGDIALVRAFNRDYTRRIGALCEGYLDSPYSLTEARVIYEIAQREDVTASELVEHLALDRGYLSRILKKFEARGIIKRQASTADGRRRHLRLTPAGKREFMTLNRRSQQQVQAMLSSLDAGRRRVVLNGMRALRTALNSDQASKPTAGSGITLRPHQPGDIGWVIEQHGQLYAQEYGWNLEFEALVAEIAAQFIRKFDPTRERCWIAERDGKRLGCIFLVAKDRSTAKLRLLLVKPEARGAGLGRTLVSECVRFAREAGYRKIVLWTQKNLTAARHLYAEAGFRKVAEEPHHSFGKNLISETWELSLRSHAAHERTGRQAKAARPQPSRELARAR
ncbi:MAG: MarR family transcriptional regulator [Steroidobacteraceae bacterium]|nr:MarR family transcriptional regulator [Steroidobacteraceae bacterium]